MAAATLWAGPAHAQEITSSPNVVGSGARALGMGGAFIAIADDATAASWNPGGLTQLEKPELSLVYNFDSFSEDFSSGSHPELDGSHEVSFSQINYLSFVYPIPQAPGGHNMVLSLNYQRKFDFERELRLNINRAAAGGAASGLVASQLLNIDYSQHGSLSTISPAFGFEVSDRLSLGVVWNLWDSSLVPDNGWTERNTTLGQTFVQGALASIARTDSEWKYENIRGNNFTFGALYRATERLTFGMVYNTKFTASLDYSMMARTWGGGYQFDKRKIRYTFPSSIGLGVAYRFPNDKLTLSLDITRREWDQFIIDDPYNRDITKQHRSGVSQMPTAFAKVDPTYTVRLGGEYVFVNASKPKQDYLPSLRAGIFYDPEPSSGRSTRWFGLDRGDGKVEDFYGFSLGAGVLIKNRVNLDMAYVYRWGDGARKDTFGQFAGFTRTDADVAQHYFYISTVIYLYK